MHARELLQRDWLPHSANSRPFSPLPPPLPLSNIPFPSSCSLPSPYQHPIAPFLLPAFHFVLSPLPESPLPFKHLLRPTPTLISHSHYCPLYTSLLYSPPAHNLLLYTYIGFGEYNFNFYIILSLVLLFCAPFVFVQLFW